MHLLYADVATDERLTNKFIIKEEAVDEVNERGR